MALPGSIVVRSAAQAAEASMMKQREKNACARTRVLPLAIRRFVSPGPPAHSADAAPNTGLKGRQEGHNRAVERGIDAAARPRFGSKRGRTAAGALWVVRVWPSGSPAASAAGATHAPTPTQRPALRDGRRFFLKATQQTYTTSTRFFFPFWR